MPRGRKNQWRELFAEKIMDWGNLLFVGLVIGQFVPGANPIRWGLLLFGICGCGGAYIVANQIVKGVMKL